MKRLERKEYERMKIELYSLLRAGADNSMSRKVLASRLGLSDRTLRQMIQQMRKDGFIILSSSHGSGYYLPSDEQKLALQEISAFVEGNESRIEELEKATRSAREALDLLRKRGRAA